MMKVQVRLRTEIPGGHKETVAWVDNRVKVGDKISLPALGPEFWDVLSVGEPSDQETYDFEAYRRTNRKTWNNDV